MNITTKTLSGAEVCVAIGGQNTEIRNDGAATVYASANAGIVAGADGVVAIPAGAAVTVLDTRGKVYLLGTGEVSVVGKDTVSAVFHKAPTSGGSSGGTIDTQARTLINNHAGNTTIHTTAAEKAAWNAAESNAKLYADSLFQKATNLELEVVTTLPSNPATNKIYLIELIDSAGNYSEHMYINGEWVNVGTTTIDLTDYYNKAQTDAKLTQKADLTDIPTKTSQLTNDSGYVTSADIPTKTSELTNDSGFITSPDGGNAATLNGHSIEVTDVDPGEGVAMATGKIVMVVEP